MLSFFVCGVFFGFGGLWAGPYLMQVYGLSRAETGSVLNMLAVGLIVGAPLARIPFGQGFSQPKKVLALISALLVADVLLLNIFPSGLALSLLYPGFFIFSVCSSAIVVIGFTTTKELFPVEGAGTW